ncbi:hypothetical protein M3223_13450 [Paenibacillus pasadenensis]|uniref:hypothetical protein n=1 Tax=Paenibacillus pasadenensis TaxID=217090 RepID=UPI00203DDC0D|nr:hypothetical protein [Paenibacillus pasadenensis]MCM3748356.1 hypothetical protein [Paenibacillus pasadenensis]
MKFKCKCGEVLSNTQVPNDIELIVYTDREFEAVLGVDCIENIPDPKYEVWKCPICERVMIFDGIKLVKTYIVEAAVESC